MYREGGREGRVHLMAICVWPFISSFFEEIVEVCFLGHKKCVCSGLKIVDELIYCMWVCGTLKTKFSRAIYCFTYSMPKVVVCECVYRAILECRKQSRLSFIKSRF